MPTRLLNTNALSNTPHITRCVYIRFDSFCIGFERNGKLMGPKKNIVGIKVKTKIHENSVRLVDAYVMFTTLHI